MLKKTIKFVDYDDNTREEDFYFNLSKAELIEMFAGTSGGFDNELRRLIAAQNQPELMKSFKNVILKSYGIKSPDGRRFQKSEEISQDFEQTEAYSVLLMELMSNADTAAAFVNGIMPKELAEEANKQTTVAFVNNQ